MKNLFLNLKFAILYNVIVIALKFIVRLFLIHRLSIEYLGIDGLFSNILSILSLAELGIGPAIIYSLYKPLAIDDKETIKSIMKLFKKLYISIGIIIMAMGLLLFPWLDDFIKNKPSIENVEIFYLFFLVNTAVSYFWSYQRNLLIADQKQYIVNIYQIATQIIVAGLQIVILLVIPSYVWYLAVLLCGTIIENFVIYVVVNRQYCFLKESAQDLKEGIKNQISQNIKAMFFHKIGGVLVTSSSNIVISKYVGLTAVGLYSNYMLIIYGISAFSGRLYETITASIGNSFIKNSESENLNKFYDIELLTAILGSVFSICLFLFMNPFIEIFFGKSLVFQKEIVLCIVMQFYFNYMRKSVLLFKDAAGLFWNDRYKPIAEAVVFLVTSIFITIKYGVIGVIIGGIFSTLCVCFWVEPYVLFRYGFHQSPKIYFLKYIKHTLINFSLLFGFNYIYKALQYPMTMIGVVFHSILVSLVIVVFWVILYRKNRIIIKIKYRIMSFFGKKQL